MAIKITGTTVIDDNKNLTSINTTATGNTTITGFANVTSTVMSNGQIDGEKTRILSPQGGSYTTTTAAPTGAIKIKLPVAKNNSSTMLRFTVKIYQYSTGQSQTFEIGGYNYSLGTWVNVFATNLTDTGVNYTVRFGYDGTSDCVWIGETSTTWAYPQVYVTDVQTGYSGITDTGWASGWAISIVAAFDTVETSRTPNLLYGSSNYTAIDHNSLTNYDANKHVDHTGVTMTAGAGLTGGGTIAATRTFDVGAANGITVAADSVAVTQGTGVVVNTSGVHVNATYIGTIAANSASYANASVTNTFTIGTGSYSVTNGNFGVGNSTPAYKLRVEGTTSLAGAVSDITTLAAGNTTITGFVNATSHTVGTSLVANSSGVYHTGTVNAALVSSTNASFTRVTDIYQAAGDVRFNLGNPSVEEKALFHGEMNNKFRFIAPTSQEESTDNVTWSTSTRATANQLSDMMIGEGQSTSFIAIPSGTVGTAGYYRLTWDVFGTTGYLYLNHLYIWCETQSLNTTFTVEAYNNSTLTWDTFATGSGQNWPGHVSIKHNTIPYHTQAVAGFYSKVRITLSVPSRNNTNAVYLGAVEWFGGYPAGRRNVESYDRNKNVTFPANVVATGALTVGSTVVANTTGTYATFMNNKTESNLNVNNATTAYGKAEAALSVNNATYINGNNVTTVMESLRANQNISGGGTITVDASGYVLWSSRFIVIANGRGTNFATAGYFDITCPTSGTITGAGGAGNGTATAAGIPVPNWHALYYILPIGSGSTSLAANFRLVNYTVDVDVPSDWVLICVKNGDNGQFYFPNGVSLTLGTSYNSASVFSSALVPAANNASYLGTIAAGSYQLNSTLASNVATMSSNNASYLGTVAAASYVLNTDSRTLSGNLNFTGVNTYFQGSTLGTTAGTISNNITLYNSVGNNGYLRFLTKRNATGTDWTSVSSRVQWRIDSTDMGYIEFNPPDASSNSSGRGIAFGGNEGTEAMRVTSTGNVGIGNTAPAHKLRVTGTSSLAGAVSDITTLAAGNTTITGFINATSTLAAGNTTITGFLNVSSTGQFGGGVSGITTLATGNVTVTGFVNSSSTIAGGNTTITGFLNVSSTGQFGGGVSGITTLAAGNTTITGFANVTTSVNANSFSIGTSYTANSTVVNAVSYNIGTTVVANATHLYNQLASSYYRSGGTDVALADGGTNAALTAVAGGITYSTASALAISAAGTSGQFLISSGATAPTWSSNLAFDYISRGSSPLTLGGVGGTSVSQLHASGTTLGAAAYSAVNWGSGAGIPGLYFGKHKSGTIGTYSTGLISGDGLGEIRWASSNSSSLIQSAVIRANTEEAVTSTYGSGAIIFETGNTSLATTTERVRISSNGNVGIGTSAPVHKLQVEGGNLGVNNASIIYNQRPAAGVGTTLVVNTASGVIRESSSSRRFKYDIRDYHKGLEDVKKLKPVLFKYINDDEVQRDVLGFIAEDFDDLSLTEIVQYDANNMPISLNYNALPSLLTNAIKEQQIMIQDLTERVNLLENQLNK